MVAGIIEGVFVVFAICLAAFYTVKQMKINAALSIKSDLYRRKTDSLENIWKLLKFIGFVKNKHSIITYETIKSGTTEETHYYLNKENAQQFINKKLPALFYQKSAGLYTSKLIKELIFEYRNIIASLISENHNNEEVTFMVTDYKSIERLKKN